MPDTAMFEDELRHGIPSNHIAALDIGSNSFHFVYARVIDNNIQVLHREKYRVRLAAGLDEHLNLTPEAMERALGTLELLAPTVEKLGAKNFRAVATYTLRRAKNVDELLTLAERVFPYPIEIINGHEEARLIYQGVAHTSETKGRRLVIDIGGGSTELIVGEGYEVVDLVSLNMGCVNYTNQFFFDGKLKDSRFDRAIVCARDELSSKAVRFGRSQWRICLGSSGTIKAISRMIIDNDIGDHQLSLLNLQALRRRLINAGHIDALNIVGLNENRRPVICAGLCILIALFDTLEIDTMDYSESALREGVIYQLHEQKQDPDIRGKSVKSLQQRFSVDVAQAEQVEATAKRLIEAAKPAWKINANAERLLCWAAQLHEVGFDINVSSYHKHGRYIVQNADLPGFNREHQAVLAWLIESQRKKVLFAQLPYLHTLSSKVISRICLLLRLSVLINQRRQLAEPPEFSIQIEKRYVTLHMPTSTLIKHPLLVENLEKERSYAETLGLTLTVESRA